MVTGLHIIAGFTVPDTTLLKAHKQWKAFILPLIQELSLQSVGDVYHDFHNGGFTAIICLTESHLSIHTYPEIHYVAFDIYLSNYSKDNSQITQQLYINTRNFFNPTSVNVQFIER